MDRLGGAGVIEQPGEIALQARQLGYGGPHLIEPSLQDAHHVFARRIASVSDGEHLKPRAVTGRRTGRSTVWLDTTRTDPLEVIATITGLGYTATAQP